MRASPSEASARRPAQAAQPVDQAQQPFTVNGTLLDITNGRWAELETSGITGQPTAITLDLAWLGEGDAGFVNLEDGTAISVLVEQLPDGTYRAIQYQQLAKGSQVNNTDWGVNEEYTTRDGSINARVDNGPDDDEARAQGANQEDNQDDS